MRAPAVLRPLVLSLATLACGAASDLTITVPQLVQFIQSTIQLRQPDRQVADYLHHVRLLNRLDARTIEDLQGSGAGPKTLAALNILKDGSKNLNEAPPLPPKPVIIQIAPPDSLEQGRLLDAARGYGLSYTQRLPDFVCSQITRRFFDRGDGVWRFLDSITTQLTYFDQKEDYKVVLVGDQPVTNFSLDRLGGTLSAGEFGSMMNDIFSPSSETRFDWERWATLRGKRNYVFSYDIAPEHSHYRLTVDRVYDTITGCRGLIYIEKETGNITRITLQAYGIPVAFPVRDVRIVLDYGLISIGNQNFMLPVKAEVASTRSGESTRNEIEFRMYRKFGTDTTITFEK